jgi:hypothetical protein
MATGCIALVLLYGCASLPDAVERLVSEQQFAEARKRLDEAARSKKDDDLTVARERFRAGVERKFLGDRDRYLQEGRPRRAVERLDEGLTLCPWCPSLQRAKDESLALIQRIDVLGREASELSAVPTSDEDTIERARRVLQEARAVRALLADSRHVEQELRKLEARVVTTWARILGTATRVTAQEAARLSEDLVLLGIVAADRREIFQLMRDVSTLAGRGRGSLPSEALDAVRRASRSSSEGIRPIKTTLVSRLSDGIVAVLRHHASLPRIEHSTVEFAEETVQVLSGTWEQQARIIASAAHLKRARQLAGTGRSAVLSLVHVERARELGLPSDAQVEATETQRLAGASFAASGRLGVTAQIDTNPEIEPFVQNLVTYSIFDGIRRRSASHLEWKLLGRYERGGQLRISLDEIVLLLPSRGDLSPVRSTYLSHFEDVPNARKSQLRIQLDLERISLDSAESSLRAAITTHNIYPTPYSLTNVNLARTRYYTALNNYNFLVDLYNATPSTVSRPVFLPYVFSEGTVRHGWRLKGTVAIGQAKEVFSIQQVDEDFIRLGSREDDKEVRFRRQDLLDMRIGAERLIEQLVAARETIVEKVAGLWGNLDLEARGELSRSEKALLAAALSPFGPERVGTHQPAWARRSLERIRVPSVREPEVPKIVLQRPRGITRGGIPQDIHRVSSPLVATIFSKGNSSSIGSGALISGEGLVVTAAHVLGGGSIEVAFPDATDARRRSAEIVFVNDKHDVALIRVTGFRSQQWLELAIEEPIETGEDIVTIGSPSLGQDRIVPGALSTGIVSKAYDGRTSGGLASLVASVTVASGSSGGPLISQGTGKIVGIVTAVVSPTVSEEFASSGFWVLAAPSTELSRWLGLTYQP